MPNHDKGVIDLDSEFGTDQVLLARDTRAFVIPEGWQYVSGPRGFGAATNCTPALVVPQIGTPDGPGGLTGYTVGISLLAPAERFGFQAVRCRVLLTVNLSADPGHVWDWSEDRSNDQSGDWGGESVPFVAVEYLVSVRPGVFSPSSHGLTAG